MCHVYKHFKLSTSGSKVSLTLNRGTNKIIILNRYEGGLSQSSGEK